jgi:hypothetical protein
VATQPGVLTEAEAAPDQLEVDNSRLVEIGLALSADAPLDKQWPLSDEERKSLELERDGIRDTHAWYSRVREVLFRLAGGHTRSRFTMRLDGSAPDASTEQRLRKLEEGAGVGSPEPSDVMGTDELWSTAVRRHYDLAGRVRYFANLLLEHKLVTKEQLARVELRPPTQVRRDGIRAAEVAERELPGTIHTSILREVESHAAKHAELGDGLVREDIVRRNAGLVARREALILFNERLTDGGFTLDYLKAWTRKCASKGLLPKSLNIPGLGDIAFANMTRGLR